MLFTYADWVGDEIVPQPDCHPIVFVFVTPDWACHWLKPTASIVMRDEPEPDEYSKWLVIPVVEWTSPITVQTWVHVLKMCVVVAPHPCSCGMGFTLFGNTVMGVVEEAEEWGGFTKAGWSFRVRVRVWTSPSLVREDQSWVADLTGRLWSTESNWVAVRR